LAVPRPREGVCGGAKFFGSAIQPVRSVCVSSERFFISIMKRLCLNISILHRGNVKVRYQNLGEGGVPTFYAYDDELPRRWSCRRVEHYR